MTKENDSSLSSLEYKNVPSYIAKRQANLSATFLEHGKIPPQVCDLEEVVLGAMMIEKDAITKVVKMLQPEHFYKEAHQIIYKAIYTLFLSSTVIDILTVTEQLKKQGELEVIGGAYYLTQLTGRVSSSAHIEHHAFIIVEKYIKREIIRISADSVKDGFDDTTDTIELLDNTISNFIKLNKVFSMGKSKDIAVLVEQSDKVMKYLMEKKIDLIGIPSLLKVLDDYTHGFQKTDYIIIAGRPSMGKTALGITLLYNIAVIQKKPAGFLSLEMSDKQLINRLKAVGSQVNLTNINNGNLSQIEYSTLQQLSEQLSVAPIYIDDTPAINVVQLRAKVTEMVTEHKVEVIFLDYIQMMSGIKERGVNREGEISEISRNIKAMAKEFDIPFIAIAQLNRAVEQRGGDKVPVLSDLRESGAMEMDADVVMLVYRPEYYGIKEYSGGASTAGMADIIIAKQRNGRTGRVSLKFKSTTTTFTNLRSEDDVVEVPVSSQDVKELNEPILPEDAPF